MDAFKTSNNLDWQSVWKERMEPYIENYRPYSVNNDWTELLQLEGGIALYYEHFSIR